MRKTHHSSEVSMNNFLTSDSTKKTRSTFRTLLLLPSITRRIDDQLLVKELNAKFFHHSILERLLIAALTPSVAGVEYDYERLELLGMRSRPLFESNIHFKNHIKQGTLT